MRYFDWPSVKKHGSVAQGLGFAHDLVFHYLFRDILTFLHGDGTDSATLLEAANTLESPA